MFGKIKKLKEEVSTLRHLLEETEGARKKCYDTMMDLYAKQQRLERFSVFYTLTDSDFVNFSQNSARKRAAKQRMAMSLGNKIVKDMEIDEVVEDGVLVGYKIVVNAMKVTDNPKLVPERKNDYEGIWEEAQK